VKNKEVEIILKEALDEKTAKIKAIEYLETWFKYATLIDNDFLPKFKLQKIKKVVMNSNERIMATNEDRIYGQLTIIREKDKFITYPKTFCFDECTKILAKRYTDYMEGKEKLISFANFLRSLLNDFKVKKTKGKKYYQVSLNLMKKLGKVVGKHGRGNILEARTASKNKFKPLSQDEKEWLQKIIPRVILHMGKIAYCKKYNKELPGKINKNGEID
jgi:hypothetical protein